MRATTLRRLFFVSAAAAAAPLAVASSAWACDIDADCAEGEICLATPCAAPDCDPDDPDCEVPECEGVCVDEDDAWDDGSCETDADCGEGYLCVVETGEVCSDTACPEGAECPDTEPVCETYEWSYCQYDFEECTTDADCSDDFVCVTYTYDECPPMPFPDCAPGEECPEPAPVECETTSESFCAPPYIAPCEVDSDCGEGFACVEAQSCWCSGGGGTGTDTPPVPGEGGGSSGSSGGSSGGGEPDGGAPDEPGMPDREGGGGGEDFEEDCGCEPTGEFYCEPQVIECEADSDCPDTWTCMEASVGTAPCTFDEETGETWCPEPEEATSYCMPPSWDVWGAGAGSPDGGYAEAVADATGAPRDAASGGDGESGGLLEVVGGGGGSGGEEKAGCTAAAGAAPLGAWLVGLVAVTRRRRSRSAR